MSCAHEASEWFPVCRHLLEQPADVHVERFTGRGPESELLCHQCLDKHAELDRVCAACRETVVRDGNWTGIVGAPGITEARSALRFERGARLPALADLQPVRGGDRDVWIGLGLDGMLARIDFDRGDVRPIARAGGAVDLGQPMVLHVSRDARLAAVVNRRGLDGVVIDLETGKPTMQLVRDGYHADQCDFSLAFVERGGRTLVIHPSAWNRLDISDARTGELLTARGPTAYGDDGVRPIHYLDYFHCGLSVSPDQRFVVDSGWVWHPVGIVAAWSLERWLDDNVWESEDGRTRRALCWRDYFWDGPLCWLDEHRLAVWGYGLDGQWLVDGVRIFDVGRGVEERWFPGPRGPLCFDGVLVSGGDGASVWDVARGARLLHDPRTVATHVHPTARTFAGVAADGVTASRLCGHHADAEWNRGAVVDIARAIARDRSFDELPVLGDALLLAGCTDDELLAHCRDPGQHGDRCWVLERLARE